MLAEFEQFLKDKERLPEKYVPFYLKWVAECYRFLDLPYSQQLSSDEESRFLKNLHKTRDAMK